MHGKLRRNHQDSTSIDRKVSDQLKLHHFKSAKIHRLRRELNPRKKMGFEVVRHTTSGLRLDLRQTQQGPGWGGESNTNEIGKTYFSS
jgi:hypothetical protein